MHQVQAENGQLHDKVSVIDIWALVFPGALMVQVPQVNGVPVKQINTFRFTCLTSYTEQRRQNWKPNTPYNNVSRAYSHQQTLHIRKQGLGLRMLLYWFKLVLIIIIIFMSHKHRIDSEHIFSTSAAMKATVCMPWRCPTRPQSTARPTQHVSMDTSRAKTRTWLPIGVVGENDSWQKEYRTIMHCADTFI